MSYNIIVINLVFDITQLIENLYIVLSMLVCFVFRIQKSTLYRIIQKRKMYRQATRENYVMKFNYTISTCLLG